VEEVDFIRLNGGSVSFISPLATGCIIVPSKTGCTKWKEEKCREVPQKKFSMYEEGCFPHNGRIIRNCQTRTELVPAPTSLSVCGQRVERSCLGPCFNCEDFCRPQYENTCWRNHEVKKEVETRRVEGSDIYVEKDELESLYSCSQKKVGDICAPVNCRFIEQEEDCTVKNETEYFTLNYRTCDICIQRLTETVNESTECRDTLREDCREEFSLSWTKLCSVTEFEETYPESDSPASEVDQEHIRNSGQRQFPELLYTDEKRRNIATTKQEENRSNLQENLGQLYEESLNPVNSLILETLRRINVEDLKKDTVVVISTPRPPTVPLPETRSNENFLNDILRKVMESEKEGMEVLKDMIEDPVTINVNVKYEFEEESGATPLSPRPSAPTPLSSLPSASTPQSPGPSPPTPLSSQPSPSTSQTSRPSLPTPLSSQPSASTPQSSGPSAPTPLSSQPSSSIPQSSRPSAPALNDASTSDTPSSSRSRQILGQTSGGGKQTDISPSPVLAGRISDPIFLDGQTEQQTVVEGANPAVYFDPTLEVLNERERIVLSEPATRQPATTARPVIFKQNISVLPSIATTNRPTTTTTTTTTAKTTTSSENVIQSRPRQLNSVDLLKLCFLNNIGCDFSLNEVVSSSTTTTTSTTTTSTTTTTEATTSTTAMSKERVQMMKRIFSVEEKVRLCFRFGICSEEEIQEHMRGGPEVTTQRTTIRRRPRGGSTLTTTTARPSTTESDRFAAIKARASACIWNGIC